MTSSPTHGPATRRRPRATARSALVALAVAASIGATLTGGGAQAAAKTSSASVKAPASGLMDRHHAPKAGFTEVVRGYVVNTTWAALQPAKGGPIVHPNPVDQAIAVAKKNGYTLKLRVRAGIDAPDWAKKLGGAPMTFYYTGATAGKAGTAAGTVGRFWAPSFGAAYQDLQNKLAAAYDGVPEIRQTDITRCSTIFAETYLRDAMDRRNVRTLLAAGFTRAADEKCHIQQIRAHQVWTRTISDLAFNPYNSIRPDATVRSDLAYTLSQMTFCRTVLGSRCSLSNHSLASKRLTTGAYGEMYAHMRKLGGPIDLQTATAAKIGDFREVLAFASWMGASSVELPTGYERWSMADVTTAAGRLTG
jgi:hypothetical protein